MMSNLFSSFDPATSINLSLNWMAMTLFCLIIPYPFWVMPNQYSVMFHNISNTLFSDYKSLINKKSPIMLMLISLFIFIMLNNLMGLLPYVYTSSSQLSFSLALAMPLWMSFMLFGWINNCNHMFAHLIPSGTPAVLMPFMVCIETTSNIIRPGSLSVRLTANMIAGHLLMTLLGNNMTNCSPLIMPMILIIQMMLMWFETAVSLIQAYVFSVLSTLYSSEVI
uniref:ATP synthase subunit a n=1 Tax=Brachyrhynchus hsiaoi TaxID=928820 RepID=A0A059P0N6_9HEMI|nr:ATP synthase F0 subunit 6 [Brachyrhynchus hsiaoi]ADQ64019.1 ATP synthase F0 subunit 6 [Brachyrhynchus hsiaoi]